ncbi:MAG: hypothetical protein WAT79_13740 [Saprospiraceae bacterium]
MTKKILIGTITGFIVGSIMAGIIFFGLLGSMAEQWMKDHASCLKEMDMMGGVFGSLIFSYLMAILLEKYDVKDFKSGAITAAWITVLVVSWYAIWNVYTFTAYGWDWLPYDIIGNTVVGAVAGGVVGIVYGKLK